MPPEISSAGAWTPALLIAWVIVHCRHEIVRLVLGLALIARAVQRDIPALARLLFGPKQR